MVSIIQIIFGNLLSSIAVLEMAYIATDSCDKWGDILEGVSPVWGGAIFICRLNICDQQNFLLLLIVWHTASLSHYNLFGQSNKMWGSNIQ